MINESFFTELNLKMGDLQLTVRKNGCYSFSNTQESMLENHVGSVSEKSDNREAEKKNHSPSKVKQTPDNRVIQQSLEDEIAEQGFTPIKSPMLGIFYEAPEPGASPFVETGTLVEADTTVCTIEVMKLFSTIKAGVRGRIKQVCVENGKMVEYGQILFVVDPNVE